MAEQRFEVHPIAELIPPMSEGEYAELKADLAANGQQEAITLYENKILDGRHRARALGELGIRPLTRRYKGDTPLVHVVSLNVHRRSLSPSQRAALAVDLLPALEEEARRRQLSGLKQGDDSPLVPPGTNGDGRSRCQAADLLGVGETSVGRAKRVKRDDPDLFERVRRGEVLVNAAYREVTSTPLPKPKPLDLSKPRNRLRADAAIKRIESALARVSGMTDALGEADLGLAIATAGPEQISAWRAAAKASARTLTTLARDLREVEN